MAAPVITVDMAFGSNPGAAAFVWTNIHTDGVNMRVRDLTYSRGRVNELNQMQAGLGAVVVADPYSDFDPDNPAGLYGPSLYGAGAYGAGLYGGANIRPYVPIRAQATIAGTTYPLFQHFVERLPRTTRVTNVYTERSFTTVDGFEWMANAGLNGASYAQMDAGSRALAVLATIGWPASRASTLAASAIMQAVTFAANDNTKALTHLLQAQQDENGLFYINAAGNAVFVGRHALITSPYTVSQATFRDATSGGTGYPCTQIVPAYDLDTTYNQWTGTQSGSSAIAGVTDPPSQAAYGLRSQQFTSTVTTLNDVLAQAQWKLYQFKNPLNRIRELTVMPGRDTSFWQAVLALELGSRVTVREQPPGYATPKTADYTIQSISVHIPQDGAAAAQFTFALWPAVTTTFWILNTSRFNDQTVVAY